MSAPKDEILGFLAEWYDPQPQMTKLYLVKIFTDSGEIEIYDKKLNSRFLKRCPLPNNLNLGDFHLGAKVLLHARMMTIVDYADPYTRRKLMPHHENSTVLLGPDAYYNLGNILDGFTSGTGLKVSKLQGVVLAESELMEVLPLLGLGSSTYEQMVKFWCSGMCVAVELKGSRCEEILPPLVDRLRQKFASNALEQAVWYASGLGDFFFGPRQFNPTAHLAACTCAVIRPHAVKSGDLGAILNAILSSRRFEVTALRMLELSKSSASEFLEVYEGVMPDFPDMVLELCSGPLVALEVKLATSAGPMAGTQSEDDVTSAFRDFVGPWDVEMARELRPGTIRARFGKSRTQNAIHCTDLADDGPHESAYFFEVLQGS